MRRALDLLPAELLMTALPSLLMADGLLSHLFLTLSLSIFRVLLSRSDWMMRIVPRSIMAIELLVKLIDLALAHLVETLHLVRGDQHRIASAVAHLGTRREPVTPDHMMSQE